MDTIATRTGLVAYEEQGTGSPLILLLAVLETGHEPFAEDPAAFLQAIDPFLHALEGDHSSHASSNQFSASDTPAPH
jgi:hypothetical protein